MTTPIFNPDLPLRKDIFADSQIDFLDNFLTLYNAFAQNHVALDAASNAGNHTIVQLLEQDINNQFQTNVGEISVYTKNVPGQTDQIFLRFQGNQQEFQFTNFQIFKNPDEPNQTFFFTFLPGKILLYFGVIIPNAATFTLNLIPPIAKNIASVNFCPIGTGASPFYPPIANPASTIPGFINQLILTSSFSVSSINVPPCYYMVMANI